MKQIHLFFIAFTFFAITSIAIFAYVHTTSSTYTQPEVIVDIPEETSEEKTVPDPAPTVTAGSTDIPTSSETVPPPQSLDTVSTEKQSFSFTVLADADNYDEPTGHNAILPSMLALSAKRSPDFAIFTGDLVTMPDPSTQRVASLKKLLDSYYKKYYIAFGKHDMECGVKCAQVWQKIFFDSDTDKEPTFYHSFDHDNVHFVLLSSDYPLKHGVDDTQLAWLKKDLAENTHKDRIIVISHVPPVNFYEESAEECHDMTCDEPRRQKLTSLLEQYDVDLVLSGHEHAFDHKIVNSIDYIIAGNIGNGKRYKNTVWKNSYLHVTVNEKTLLVTSYDENNTVIRTITIPF